MAKIISALKLHRFAFTLVTLSCLAMVVGAGIGWQTQKQTTANEALITNKTKAIRVTDVTVNKEVVFVTLLNQALRYVDLYSFSIGRQIIMPTY